METIVLRRDLRCYLPRFRISLIRSLVSEQVGETSDKIVARLVDRDSPLVSRLPRREVL